MYYQKKAMLDSQHRFFVSIILRPGGRFLPLGTRGLILSS